MSWRAGQSVKTVKSVTGKIAEDEATEAEAPGPDNAAMVRDPLKAAATGRRYADRRSRPLVCSPTRLFMWSYETPAAEADNRPPVWRPAPRRQRLVLPAGIEGEDPLPASRGTRHRPDHCGRHGPRGFRDGRRACPVDGAAAAPEGSGRNRTMPGRPADAPRFPSPSQRW
jgi:hypothetical protein